MIKQVLFADIDSPIHYGLLTEDGNIICLCCGGIIEPEDYKIVKVYPDWLNLDSVVEDEIADEEKKFLEMTATEYEKWFDDKEE